MSDGVTIKVYKKKLCFATNAAKPTFLCLLAEKKTRSQGEIAVNTL